ncbi:hypothetical protein KR009_007827, partial [Drosophila setifemur]
LINVIIVQNKMIAIMWSELECNELAIEHCQCPRLLSPTDATTNDPSTQGVSLRYQTQTVWSTNTVTILLLAVLLCLAPVLGAPQTSCIMCDKEDLRPRVTVPYTDGYVEYTFDHQVSRQQAIDSIHKFNETHGKNNACSSIQCPSNVMKYCQGTQFINDHCWCEMQHREEGLPYVPHICYADEKVHKPSVGSCFAFVEVKECCCAATWVKK